jgi:hypothetical protein
MLNRHSLGPSINPALKERSRILSGITLAMKEAGPLQNGTVEGQIPPLSTRDQLPGFPNNLSSTPQWHFAVLRNYAE